MRQQYRSGGPSVDFYDVREVGGPGPCDGDLAFYLREARRTRGPILELGCGTGRVSLPLAEAGFDVVGLDQSPFMLRAARRKAEAAGARIAFVRGNMARFDLGRRFRLVLIPFRAFQHLLTPADQRGCLQCIRRHLRPGGRLIVHLFDPRLEFCVPGRHEARAERPSGRDPESGHRVDVMVTSRRTDPLTQTFTERWLWTVRDRGGTVLRRVPDVLTLRWTYRYEMAYLFELTGFAVRACYSDFFRSPPRYGAEQVWVVERR